MAGAVHEVCPSALLPEEEQDSPLVRSTPPPSPLAVEQGHGKPQPERSASCPLTSWCHGSAPAAVHGPLVVELRVHVHSALTVLGAVDGPLVRRED